MNDPLSINELKEAEVRILKMIQNKRFSNEISRISKGERVKDSKTAAFNPFFGKDGLLRVGSRLKHGKKAFSQKHQILLPSRHHLTDLIIRKFHSRNYHAGTFHVQRLNLLSTKQHRAQTYHHSLYGGNFIICGYY